ncbi:MAG: DUF1549 domain-containing protein [Verrucomicrobiota bacterium]
MSLLNIRNGRGAVVAAGVLVSSISLALADFPGQKTEPVDLTPEMVKQKAFEIDKFVAATLHAQGSKPLDNATDEQFLRRVYLGIVGRIPSYDEAKAFLEDEDADKRSKLIDQLLESPGYVSNMYNFWADVLRLKMKTGGNNRTNAIPYLNYVRQTIAENKPYDEWVHEMITASGGGWQRSSNGAVGYLERDKGMPLDNMANTMQVFTGTRMECAQCHNHPNNEEIEQKDFFYMAAFTHGLKGPRDMNRYSMDSKERMEERRMYENAPQPVRNMVQQLRYDIFDFGVKGGGDGVIPLPDDYQYRDLDPGEIVGAKTLFGKSVRNARAKPIDDSRELFAEWLTTSENPRFTKVISNRLWKKVMARGLFEPVDNLDEDPTISHPQLLAFLEKLMVQVDYDMKEFMRVLYNTRTFQFAPNPEEVDVAAPYTYPGRMLTRMTAEQLWDSMLAATIPDSDERKGTNFLPFIQYRGRYVLVGQKDMYDLYEEAMSLQGKELYDFVGQLLKDMESDRGASEGEMMEMMSSQMADSGSAKGAVDDKRWSGYSSALLRASELPSPAPATHFLRKFGQSAREVIEGATTESDVTQILSLINGHVEDHIVGKSNAKVFQDMNKVDTPEEKIDVAFLSILTRKPTADEMNMFVQNVNENGATAYDDLVWTLYNTSEFMFVQ